MNCLLDYFITFSVASILASILILERSYEFFYFSVELICEWRIIYGHWTLFRLPSQIIFNLKKIIYM